jgi:hypothetical protein
MILLAIPIGFSLSKKEVDELKSALQKKYIYTEFVVFFDYPVDKEILNDDFLKGKIIYYDIQQGIGITLVDAIKYAKDNNADVLIFANKDYITELSQIDALPKPDELILYSRYRYKELSNTNDEYRILQNDISLIFQIGYNIRITDIHPPIMLMGKEIVNNIVLDDFTSGAFIQLMLKTIYSKYKIIEKGCEIKGDEIWIWEDRKTHISALKEYYKFLIDSENILRKK